MEPPSIVSVRIRGRGETTVDAELNNAETVETFKKRVFKDDLAAGKKCRLIARGKELQDSRILGSYNIEDGSCMHVVIGGTGSSSRPSHPANVSSTGTVLRARVRTGTQQGGGHTSAGPGFAILCSLLLGMIVTAWIVFVMRPELFSAGAMALLLLLTLLVLTLILPALKSALVACRLPFVDSRPPHLRRRRQ